MIVHKKADGSYNTKNIKKIIASPNIEQMLSIASADTGPFAERDPLHALYNLRIAGIVCTGTNNPIQKNSQNDSQQDQIEMSGSSTLK